eukprot:5702439-Pyramimonas_sp.AAC.1
MELVRTVMGLSWFPVRQSWGPLGPSWAVLRRHGALLSPLRGPLGRMVGVWGPVGPSRRSAF